MERDQTPIESGRQDPNDITESQVVFPASSEQVMEFISGLLGKPQSMDRSYSGQFSISYDDVINTHQLIEQRIHQQNEASLAQFVVSIYYNDNSTVRLNSLKAFRQYSEVKPLVCVGVTLSWIYLVKFQQKNTLEKQQIDLSFQTGQAARGESIVEPIIQYSPSEMRFISSSRGGIHLRINYTERTWGNDIDSLLDGHIKTLVQEPMGFHRWVWRHSGKIGWIVAIAIILGAIFGSAVTTSEFIDANKETFLESTARYADDIQAINQKLDYMADIVTTGIWPRFIIRVEGFFILSVVVSAFLGFWVAEKADTRPISFILLSQESKKNKDRYDKKRKRDWAMFFISIFVSLAIGVVSNVLFHKYFSTL